MAGRDPRRGMLRTVLAAAALLALAGGVGWATGFTLRPGPVLAVLCAVAVLAGIDRGLPRSHPVPWPDPSPAAPQRWFGTDREVRRLASLVEMAQHHGDDNGLRAALRAEAERRLVAHHGAAATDPLAGHDDLLHPDLRRALAGGRITRRQWPALLAHLEDL